MDSMAAFARSTGMQVPSPPSSSQRRAELVRVHQLTDARSPGHDAQATALDERGAWGMWQDEARVYRTHVGSVDGWIGTMKMDAAIAVATMQTQLAKRRYHQPRPFQLDPQIQPLGPIPRDSSYPSGHAAAAAAAAGVLSELWPEHRPHYEQLAASVEWARVYSGVHFPSDVVAGDAVGRAAARIVGGSGRDTTPALTTA